MLRNTRRHRDIDISRGRAHAQTPDGNREFTEFHTRAHEMHANKSARNAYNNALDLHVPRNPSKPCTQHKCVFVFGMLLCFIEFRAYTHMCVCLCVHYHSQLSTPSTLQKRSERIHHLNTLFRPKDTRSLTQFVSHLPLHSREIPSNQNTHKLTQVVNTYAPAKCKPIAHTYYA